MQCQMPGCKNQVTHFKRKEGIFSGIYLDNVIIFTCNDHLTIEIEKQLENLGEEEANLLQPENNCFSMASKKLSKKLD